MPIAKAASVAKTNLRILLPPRCLSPDCTTRRQAELLLLTTNFLFDGRLTFRDCVENGFHSGPRARCSHSLAHDRDPVCSGGEAERGGLGGYPAKRNHRA